MRILMIAGMVATGGYAAAQEPLEFAVQVSRCWNPAPLVDNFEGAFDVVLSDKGMVEDIAVTAFDPSDEDGRNMVRSVSTAVERCAPYFDVPPGVNSFTIMMVDGDIVTPPTTGPIDPFKPLKTD